MHNVAPSNSRFCVSFLVAIYLTPEQYPYFGVFFCREVLHHSSEYLKLQISSCTLLRMDVFEILMIKFSSTANFKHCKFILKVLLRFKILELKHVFINIESSHLCIVLCYYVRIPNFLGSSFLEHNSWQILQQYSSCFLLITLEDKISVRNNYILQSISTALFTSEQLNACVLQSTF